MFKRSFSVAILVLTGLLCCGTATAWTKPLKVLASTFPIYQITRNLSQGVEDIEVSLMIPAGLGCPHDYALTPQDMQKLAKADVLIINGLGLEEFLGAPLKKANARLRLIDSSAGISEVLRYGAAEEHDPHETPHHHDDDDHHGHHHDSGPNPHLFASPRMVALLADNIAKGLAAELPAQTSAITANSKAYAERMNRLADTMATAGKQLANTRIVTQHGVFDYLARDMGLKVVAVVQAHAGQEPSAAEMLALIADIKAQKAGAIFTEPQYPQAVGQTIAKEAGIGSARLDPVANGPEQAPLAYYEQVMRENLKTLEQTLGRR